MRISDWSSDVCSSDLPLTSRRGRPRLEVSGLSMESETAHGVGIADVSFTVAGGEILGIAGVAGNGQGELLAALAGERLGDRADCLRINGRSEEHTSELQSLMRISYAVFCLNKQKTPM